MSRKPRISTKKTQPPCKASAQCVFQKRRHGMEPSGMAQPVNLASISQSFAKFQRLATQWRVTHRFLGWHHSREDPKWEPVSSLLIRARPMFLQTRSMSCCRMAVWLESTQWGHRVPVWAAWPSGAGGAFSLFYRGLKRSRGIAQVAHIDFLPFCL